MLKKVRHFLQSPRQYRLVSLALVVLLILPLALTSAAVTQAQETITIRVWGYGLDDARAKARVAVFQQANPNIKIEPVGGALNTQQLLTAVASGDPPEVVNVDRFQVGSWAGRNAIDPLDDLIERDKFDLTQFYPFTIEQVKYKGKTYGIPQFVNLDLFFMNLDVLKEAGIDPATVDPGNWDQLKELGTKLAKVDGNKVTRTGFDTKMQDGRLWLWSWANGVDLISADGQKVNFNDPKVIEALEWAKSVVDAQGGEKARAAFSQSQNFFSPQNPVLIGQTAMTIFEQWLIGVMKVNPNANFRTMLPRMRNSTQNITDATGTAFAIPKGVKDAKREAAWKFITGMTSADAWIAGEKATFDDNKSKNTPYHPTITGNMKADQEAWNNIFKGISPAYDETVKLFPEALKAAHFRYSGPVAAEIADYMTAAVNDALQGVRSPKDAMEDLQKKALQAIDNFNKGPGNR
ncbi:MAG: ABC transporter substrate-binding protein [Anaerolineae bacterium]|nr:ABC transporter substrate-binding protein [Anaerolineae bacterium]